VGAAIVACWRRSRRPAAERRGQRTARARETAAPGTPRRRATAIGARLHGRAAAAAAFAVARGTGRFHAGPHGRASPLPSARASKSSHGAARDRRRRPSRRPGSRVRRRAPASQRVGGARRAHGVGRRDQPVPVLGAASQDREGSALPERGRHSRSIEPLRPTSAAISQSPIRHALRRGASSRRDAANGRAPGPWKNLAHRRHSRHGGRTQRAARGVRDAPVKRLRKPGRWRHRKPLHPRQSSMAAGAAACAALSSPERRFSRRR
jgi:hypothetical protein